MKFMKVHRTEHINQILNRLEQSGHKETFYRLYFVAAFELVLVNFMKAQDRTYKQVATTCSFFSSISALLKVLTFKDELALQFK